VIKQHTGSNEKAEKEAEKEIEDQLKDIKTAGEKSKGKVIEDLIKAVTDVDAHMHKNVTKQ